MSAAVIHRASDHAATVRELEETIRIYANQIQVLDLRNADLDADNQRLRTQVGRMDADVIPLRQPPATPGRQNHH